ncbi:MAG: lycopene cyclase domain-containing protein [bacterium]|nr:lycopene cyclase domain-containing protein [bacterium]
MERFTYLIWDLFFLTIWLLFFLLRKDLRKQSLILGGIIAGLTPLVGWWYLRDYWNPAFMFEINIFGLKTGPDEILMGFLIGAISSIVFEVVFKKKLEQKKKPHLWAFPVFLLGGVYLVAVFLVLKVGLNSIYASFVSWIVGIIILSFLRRDLIVSGLISGVLFMAILFFSYVRWLELLFPGTIVAWWKLSNLSGLLVFGVPIEEIIWGFLWGWLAGMLYEVWRGLGPKK